MVDFADSCLSEGLGPARIIKYLSMLTTMAAMQPFDFEKASRADIEQLAAKIEGPPGRLRRPPTGRTAGATSSAAGRAGATRRRRRLSSGSAGTGPAGCGAEHSGGSIRT